MVGSTACCRTRGPLPHRRFGCTNLSEFDRRKTAELAATLADPDVGTSALDTLRGLIE
ncbi:hypothetical protein [Kaistia terrae]|uniref:Uncharacterized protein n=1 Tax=Kaistia terrae TaxID=537017 RepID=A0ABW0PV24_9HYPH|nr:hypothetical protein [Kaistia terrae]MCX5577029.1 hypothetical protein [Kaistia terrae]